MGRTTRLGIIGFGLIGRRHAQAIALEASEKQNENPKTELVAVVEPDPTHTDPAGFPGVNWHSTIEELFDANEVDGVVLSTPTRLHATQALTCIENNCPVLIEKPIAVTSAEAEAVVKAANSANVPLLVGHHRRYNSIVVAAKTAIERGEIGTVRAVTASCWFYKPDSYFDEADWRKQHGAGPISVNLSHDIDLLRYFCGDVVSVQAQARKSVRGYENEDVAGALLEFKSGAIATITVSDAIASPWSWEMTSGENPAYPHTDQNCYLIGGSEGSLSIPDLRIWKHDDHPDWWRPISASAVDVEACDPIRRQIQHFTNVVSGQEPPVVSGMEGLKTLQVIEAIQNAARHQTTIKIADYENSLVSAA